ncbi:hypothetical protein I4U23_023918 [Adineta vaga]|nr:hypothetical protein I4U23_023918 [Adineta vaga]
MTIILRLKVISTMDNDTRSPRLTCSLKYLRTIPGILKIVQFVCDVICIILGGVAPSLTFTGHKGFFLFVAVLAIVITTFLILLAVINLQAVCIPERWPLIEMFCCCIIALLYCIASIVVATAAKTNGVYGAAAV